MNVICSQYTVGSEGQYENGTKVSLTIRYNRI